MLEDLVNAGVQLQDFGRQLQLLQGIIIGVRSPQVGNCLLQG
jgi:hypothetical protein